MGCHSVLQRIFPTQGLNLGLPHCRQILYCLSHQGSPLKYVKELVNSEGLTYRKCYESDMEELSVNLEPDRPGFKSQLSQFVLVVWPATSNLTTLILSLLTFQTGMPLHTWVSLKVCSGYFPCPFLPAPIPSLLFSVPLVSHHCDCIIQAFVASWVGQEEALMVIGKKLAFLCSLLLQCKE